jgi:hypothetical protein
MYKNKKGSVGVIVAIVLIFILFVMMFLWFLKRNVQMRAQQAITAQQNQTTSTKPAQTTTAPSTTSAPANEIAGWQKFSDVELGYEVKYPSEWGSLRDDDKENEVKVMIFSPKVENPSLSVTINKIQDEEGYDLNKASFFIGVLKRGISDGGGKSFDTKDFVYTFANGTTTSGKQFESEYTDAAGKVKQWIVVIPNGKNLFWMTYVSDINKYDAQRQIAQSMLDSWKITK